MLTIYMIIAVISLLVFSFALVHHRIKVKLWLMDKLGIIMVMFGNVVTIIQILSGASGYDALINSGVIIRTGLLIVACTFVLRAINSGENEP